jgi:hypothetical protein
MEGDAAEKPVVHQFPFQHQLLGIDRAEKHPSLPSTFGIESLIDGTARSLSSRFTRLHRQTELCERINRHIMNFILSSVVVLLVGALACTLLKVLPRLVVMAGVCVSVTFLALCVIRNREIIAQRISSGTFHAIAKDDQKFLDDLLRNENQEGQQQLDTARVPVANAELQINGETVRRAELVVHSGIVKRAQLVQPQRN